MKTWALILFLHVGTPQQQAVKMADRLTWSECFARALHQMKPDRSVARCQPSKGIEPKDGNAPLSAVNG